MGRSLVWEYLCFLCELPANWSTMVHEHMSTFHSPIQWRISGSPATEFLLLRNSTQLYLKYILWKGAAFLCEMNMLSDWQSWKQSLSMLTDKVNQRHAENKPISAIPVLALRCNYGETVLHVLSLLQACKRQWCTHLPDRHCAENVEEDEGAVSVILTQKVAVGQALDVWEGDKRKLCHHSAIKSEKK